MDIFSSPGAVTRWAKAEGAGRGLGGLLEGVGHDLRRQVEEGAEELNAVVGQVPVVVLPREGLPDVLLGLEALHELDDLEVQGIDLGVLGQVVVLLGVQDSLCTCIAIDSSVKSFSPSKGVAFLHTSKVEISTKEFS